MKTDTAQPALPTPPEKLFSLLDELEIKYRIYNHEPTFTVAESEHLKRHIPGLHCRNLFVRDKKEKMFLITAANETAVDLKGLESILGCKRLSFGSPQRLWQYLGVRPGHVCPFAVINDRERLVTSVLERSMMDADEICVHPMENHMTIALKPQDLVRFLESCGHTPLVSSFGS